MRLCGERTGVNCFKPHHAFRIRYRGSGKASYCKAAGQTRRSTEPTNFSDESDIAAVVTVVLSVAKLYRGLY